MATLWQDLRYGARMLLKNPASTLIAVATLSLGHRRKHSDLQRRECEFSRAHYPLLDTLGDDLSLRPNFFSRIPWKDFNARPLRLRHAGVGAYPDCFCVLRGFRGDHKTIRAEGFRPGFRPP